MKSYIQKPGNAFSLATQMVSKDTRVGIQSQRNALSVVMLFSRKKNFLRWKVLRKKVVQMVALHLWWSWKTNLSLLPKFQNKWNALEHEIYEERTGQRGGTKTCCKWWWRWTPQFDNHGLGNYQLARDYTKRSIRPPNRLIYVDYVAYTLQIEAKLEDDLRSYEEARTSANSHLWEKAMDEEYDLLVRNETW